MTFLFPGSFDPPTVGHADIIERVSHLGVKLYVGVLVNIKKQCKYTVEQRVEMLERIVRPFGGVEVVSFDGLLVDAAERLGADAIIKGLRNAADYQYESEMAQVNQAISGIDTLYIQSNPSCAAVSSSVVRELMSFNGDITGFVPECILDLL